MSSIGKLMKQASRIQEQMARVQADLAQKTVEGTSGGGAVKVTARCDNSIVAIKIDPSAVTPSDVPMLEDLVLVAVNQALDKAKETASREMNAVTSGISMPGMF